MKSGAYFLLLLLLIWGAFAPISRAFGQEDQQLQEIEEQLHANEAKKEELSIRARELSQDDEKLRAELIEAVRKVQDHEFKLIAFDHQLRAIEEQIAGKGEALEGRRREIAHLVRAMLRLAAAPDLAMLFREEDRNRLTEASRLMTGATRTLNRQSARLRAELEEISLLKEKAEEERRAIATEQARLEENRKKLDLLIDQNKLARQLTSEEEALLTQRSKELAEKATNLKELIEGSQQQEGVGSSLPAPPALRRLGSEGNGYVWPAKGEIVAKFGEGSSYFGDNNGIVIAVNWGAQVTAPFDGKVAFAGPFQSFGQIVILEHEGGYHSVLAGLYQINAVTGQWVLAGEPIGIMREKKDGADSPKLYLELRDGERIIDPAKWLP